MRFINQEDILPLIRHLLASLQTAHNEVMNEPDPELRSALIERRRTRWVALREAFAAVSHDKCWYVECKNLGTDDDVDHFRPKLAVAEEDDHPGYFWLAFDWRNLRLSCHRANRPRKDPETGVTGGKAEHFPLLDPAKRAWCPTDAIDEELPALLDPTNPNDPLLLSFAPSGEIALNPEYVGSPAAAARFEASRRFLHLDWPKFRDARLVLYNEIERLVDRGERAAPPPEEYLNSLRANRAWVDIIRDLRARMRRDQEYSAAARVYIESFRHVWWIERIVLREPA